MDDKVDPLEQEKNCGEQFAALDTVSQPEPSFHEGANTFFYPHTM